MILTGEKIKEEHVNGNIIIEPFNKECITTNSYDLTLGNYFYRYTEGTLDSKKDNPYEKIVIPQNGFVLEKGEFVLGFSNETVGSNKYVPIIHAKSGIARLGLFIHVTADLIDIGSVGQITFQMHATLPIRLYPEMKVGQVSFWETKGKIKLYDGKYQGSLGPQTSKNYLN
jgi:dCTP deaminase